MNEIIKQIIVDSLIGLTVERIILFGSRARGDNTNESDYDLYVLLAEGLDHSKRLELTDLVLGNLSKAGICADVIFATQKDLDLYGERKGTVSSYVLDEGVTI